MNRIQKLNGPGVRYVEGGVDDALFPEERISCGQCARTSGQHEHELNVCPRLPKYPEEYKHRCWYFLPLQHLEDQRTGAQRYATSDVQQKRYFGWRG